LGRAVELLGGGNLPRHVSRRRNSDRHGLTAPQGNPRACEIHSMASFNVVVVHDSDRAVVISRLQDFSQRLLEDMPVQVSDVEESWDEDGNLVFAFEALGFSVSGTMMTCDVQVKVSGQLPFAALPFRGAIENQVAEKIREAIDG
jgi:hypothetical protein